MLTRQGMVWCKPQFVSDLSEKTFSAIHILFCFSFSLFGWYFYFLLLFLMIAKIPEWEILSILSSSFHESFKRNKCCILHTFSLYYLDDPFHLCLPLLLNRFYNEEHWILLNVKKNQWCFLLVFLLVFMSNFLSLCSWGMLVYIFSLNNVPCF